jgi:hypothetical protein
MLHIDKIMGGRPRDKETAVSDFPGGNDDLKLLIQQIINDSTINWSQIIGSPTTNTELKQYFDSLVELMTYNQYQADTLITQQMQSYFNALQTSINNLDQRITNNQAVNQAFQTYISTLVNNLTTQISNITGGLVLSQDIKNYIDNLISNLTISWTQIIGSPILNTALYDYLTNLKTEILNTFNDFVLGDEVTNVLKQYIDTQLNEFKTTLQTILNQTNLNTQLITQIQNQINDIDQLIIDIQEGDQITQQYLTNLEQRINNISNTINDILNQFTSLQQQFSTFQSILVELKQLYQTLVTQVQLIDARVTEIETAITEINETITYLSDFFIDIANIHQFITNLEQRFATLEEQYTNLYETVNQIVQNAYLTEDIKNYIDSHLEEFKSIIEQLVSNIVNTEVQNYIDQITNVNGEATRLISGSVTWIENLDFLVSPLVYQILNNRYTSVEKLITIPANVANNPMYAVIYADIFGNVGYIQGNPAASPAVPMVDDATQLLLTTVYIDALGTVPGHDPNGETTDIVDEVIYNEGTEWTPAKTEEIGAAINLVDETNPATGTKHLSFTFSGGVGAYAKAALLASAATTPGKTEPHDLANSWPVNISDLFPDHKTDSGLIGDTRHLVYYRIPLLKKLSASLIKKTGGTIYKVRAASFTTENYTVPELGFSAEVPAQLTLNLLNQVLPEGDYTLVISGFEKNDQTYTATAAATYTPATAKVALTRAEAVNADGGKISISIKTLVAWEPSSAIILELFNVDKKIGSLTMTNAANFGFNTENTADYQRLTLPVADFHPTAANITKLVIRPVGDWPNGSLYIDNVTLQTGGQLLKETDKYTKSLAFDSATQELILRRSAGLENLKVPIPYTPVWSGTAAAYAAIDPKVAGTIYLVEEDV